MPLVQQEKYRCRQDEGASSSEALRAQQDPQKQEEQEQEQTSPDRAPRDVHNHSDQRARPEQRQMSMEKRFQSRGQAEPRRNDQVHLAQYGRDDTAEYTQQNITSDARIPPAFNSRVQEISVSGQSWRTKGSRAM